MTAVDLLWETHVAALRHGLVDLPDEATLVGVARRPTGRFRSSVDENRPALGPPPSLLDEFEQRCEDFKMRGMCDEGAHNAAWEELGFEARYRSHVAKAEDARKAVTDLVERLRTGEALVLVCPGNADRKRGHGTLLQDHLATRLADS